MTVSMHLRAAALALAASQVAAAPTEAFLDVSAEDFRSGDVTTITLTARGTLEAPPFRERLARLDADIVWAIARSKEGTVFAATGHTGRLWRLESGATEAELLHEFTEPAPYALTLANDGALVFAPSPGGSVRRIGAESLAKRPSADSKTTATLSAGDVATMAETRQRFIWELLPEADGSLLAATGPEGLVLRLADDGTTSTVADVESAQNIMDIERGDAGTLYLGTQGKGLVARVDASGAVQVLWDPAQEEVKRVVHLGGGRLLAAVNGVRSPGDRIVDPTGLRLPDRDKPRPVSYLVDISAEGFAREIWTSPEAPIHDVTRLEGGSVLVAAGSRGMIYEVSPAGETRTHGSVGEAVLARIAAVAPNEFLAGTGATAGIQRLDFNRRGEGVFESRVLSANASARFGRLRAMLGGDVAGITVETRSGNSKDPADHWAPWSPAEPLESGVAPVRAPIGRSLQYRIRIPATSTGRVESVRVFYVKENQAPIIRSVEARLGRGGADPKPPATPAGADAPPRPAPRASTRAGIAPPPDSNPRAIDVRWSAEDPNGDELRYTLEAQAAGSERWFPIEDELRTGEFRVDARALPPGYVRFRVTATDAPSNQAGEGATATFESPYALVDLLPPDVVRFDAQRESPDRVRITAKAEDAHSLVSTASWRADAEDWVVLLPEDGIFDDQAEFFAFTIEGAAAAAGTQITLMLTDEAGNTATRSLRLD